MILLYIFLGMVVAGITGNQSYTNDPEGTYSKNPIVYIILSTLFWPILSGMILSDTEKKD